MRPVPLLIALLMCATAMAAEPQIWREPGTGMPFVALPKGCFQMGSKQPVMLLPELTLTHLGYKTPLSVDEQPQHEVCVDAFLIGQFEVRAADWLKVMGSNPPQGSGDEPAGGISWDAAQEFARRLSQHSAGKFRFRLPTEAEWEYACRAGNAKDVTPYRGDHLHLAWYSIDDETYIPRPSVVGKLKANAWGLHDMLGNVWEWVEDTYKADAYARHELFNPVVRTMTSDGQRVIRGGSHRSEYYQVRCANRGSYPAADTLDQIGLRLVRKP